MNGRREKRKPLNNNTKGHTPGGIERGLTEERGSDTTVIQQMDGPLTCPGEKGHSLILGDGSDSS